MPELDIPMPIVAVDLFCGAGGLTRGLRSAGIEVRAGYDLDPSCKWPYEKNNKGSKFHEQDVALLTGDELNQKFGDAPVRLLAGCAPCQPFSSYSLGKTDESDDRWSMLTEFGRLVEETLPELITMENVPQLLKHEVFDQFVEVLRGHQYSVATKIVHCAEYGIPQDRKRLVLLASRLGVGIELRRRDPRRDRARTVRRAIGDMPPLKAGQSHKADPLHVSSQLSEKNMERMRQSVPGGSWRDWDKKLVADCHKSDTGKSFPSVYGRMEWDKPSPTITTQFFGFGNGRFGHPDQNRALSLREGAILQTFPKRYSFVSPKEQVEIKNVGRLIGNAVPVRLGKVIGESIIGHVHTYLPEALGG